MWGCSPLVESLQAAPVFMGEVPPERKDCISVPCIFTLCGWAGSLLCGRGGDDTHVFLAVSAHWFLQPKRAAAEGMGLAGACTARLPQPRQETNLAGAKKLEIGTSEDAEEVRCSPRVFLWHMGPMAVGFSPQMLSAQDGAPQLYDHTLTLQATPPLNAFFISALYLFWF